MAGLELEMTLHLRVRGPMPAAPGSAAGEHIYWEMSEGDLEGPRIKAHVAMPGGDWFRQGADGFGRPDTRIQFLTDDDAVVLLHYTGLVEMNDTFNRARAGRATQFEDHYWRIAMRFEAVAPRYASLNQHLFWPKAVSPEGTGSSTASTASPDRPGLARIVRIDATVPD